MKKALTIAGSDSSGGAGIQADIKTFSALGLYGTSVLTVLTAQNTKTVADILVVPEPFFKNQLLSVLDDIKPDIIKIGVLYDTTIIDIVYQVLYPLKIPIVLDPVLISGTGIKLLKEDSYDAFKKKIIPLSFVITPNLHEAEILSENKIKDEKALVESAFNIIKYGTCNVIIKGILDPNDNSKVFDILVQKNSDTLTKLYNKRLNINETHGTGCNFSSSLASFIGKGYNITEAFKLANLYVKEGLYNSIRIGKGLSITNPLYKIYDNSSRYNVILSLTSSIKILEELEDFYLIIPETKTNFVYSIERPQSLNDVAGILGRISDIGTRIKIPNVVEFGASKHVANAVISANKINNSIRSAMNIKNNEQILNVCKTNFEHSFYLREDEDIDSRNREGSTVSWGIKTAFEKENAAEIVFHQGDYGKEPMIMVFGKDPLDVINKIKLILLELKNN
ncbi:MAG TPA: bifunctional hydroxymethylpyrimidine kinase/phosphomethylpyrimidine kinase [Candidatus Nitrosocosmicus sp.]|nr:bifunctional hydroxymethylpyrimidine kinase/phosphomethylpyrimidine kinase [Candidatus Nitrosocosmicus sp.]